MPVRTATPAATRPSADVGARRSIRPPLPNMKVEPPQLDLVKTVGATVVAAALQQVVAEDAMNLSRLHVILPFAGSTVVAVAPSASSLRDKSITLSGCLIRGEGDGAGYLLISHAFDPATASTGGAPVTPGTIGTTGDFATLFYWLDGNGDLRKHIGHRVEIEGDAKGDVKDGEMKVDRKDSWTELTVKSDGRKMTARVPQASIVAGPIRGGSSTCSCARSTSSTSECSPPIASSPSQRFRLRDAVSRRRLEVRSPDLAVRIAMRAPRRLAHRDAVARARSARGSGRARMTTGSSKCSCR